MREGPRLKRIKAAVAGGMIALLVFAGGCGQKDKPETQTQAATRPTAANTSPEQPTSPAAQSTQSATQDTRYTIIAEQSTASYTIKEKFANRELPNDAVGTTSAFHGELILNGGVVKPSKITVDLRTLKSDSDRRDSRLRTSGLESDQYPFAELTISSMVGASAIPADGREVTFRLMGNMKIHGTEKPLVFDTKATLQGDMLILTAVTKFTMAEFGIKAPNIANMLTVDENVKLDVKVTAKKG